MAKRPPVPPQNRSPKGPGSDPDQATHDAGTEQSDNQDQIGEAGNIKQNTRNQGYQQDR